MADGNRVSAHIDRLTDRIGRGVSWLTLVGVLIGSFNAVARYLGRATGTRFSSNAYLELQWYLFSVIFLLGASYALRHDVHVRVDVLHARLSPRVRGWIDALGTLLLLIPFVVTILLSSWPSIRNSWEVLEASPDPGGLPRYPLKALVAVAFLLLLAQGVSEGIKAVSKLRALHRVGEGQCPPEPVPPGEGGSDER